MALLFLCVSVSAEELSEAEQRLLHDVKILASDEFEGRGVGTDGLKKAIEFVADEFRKAGLDVDEAGGDPFQEFEMSDGARLSEPNALNFTSGDKTIELTLDDTFSLCGFGGSGKFEKTPIVFVGYGIEADDAEYNDYTDTDVKDKIVIVMRRNPLQSNPHGPFAAGHGISRHAALTTKLSRAYSRGAKAIIFVSDPHSTRESVTNLEEQIEKAQAEIVAVARKINGGEDAADELKAAITHLDQAQAILEKHDADPLIPFNYGGTRSGQSIPAYHIHQSTCDAILKSGLGKSLAEVEAHIDETGKPFSQELKGWTATGEANLYIKKVPVRNVIGVLEGDGSHPNETIVVGAHVDHLGFGGSGSLSPKSKDVHNGADDNASGTSGLIEVARRIAGREKPLARRIVFIGFTGEEKGLIGSKQYVKNPLYPLDQTIAMFNMDMIGRMTDQRLTVFGVGTSDRWEPMLDKVSPDLGIHIAKKTEGFGPSDHASFYAEKIPVLHLFTGIHKDYHRPGDDWEKLNIPGMEKTVTLLETLIIDTANASERPKYVHVPGTAQITRSGSRPYFGSIPDFGVEAKGYAIQGVAPESPADKGGLKGGDVIVKINDQKIGGLDDFDLALRKYKPGQQINIVVLRDGKEVPLKVTLATPKN